MKKYQPVTTQQVVKIGEAAKILGVSIDTLRRWEEKGKLSPLRTPGQTRLYSVADLKNLNPRSKKILQPAAESIVTTAPTLTLNSLDDPLGSFVIHPNPGIFKSPADTLEPVKSSPAEEITSVTNFQPVPTQVANSSPLGLEINPKATTTHSFWPSQALKNSERSSLARNVLTTLLLLVLINIIATSSLVGSYFINLKTNGSFISYKALQSSKSPMTKLASIALLPFSLQADALLRSIYPPTAPTLASSNSLASAGSDQPGDVLAATSPSQVYLEVNSDETVNGTLTVNGNSVIRDSLTAPNISGDTTVNGSLTSTGNLTSQGSLQVLGVSTLNSGLTVAGNITFSQLKAGFVKSDANGKISTGAINVGTSDITGTVPITNGGTGATNASDARGNLGAASSGSNSDITSLNGLTTALSTGQGGTGLTTYSTGDLIYASGTNALSTIGIGSSNEVLTVINGVPTWKTVSGAGGGVNTLNTLSGDLTIAGGGINTVSTSGSTITITGTEADNLASVTGRGSSTGQTLTLSSANPLALTSTSPTISIGNTGTLSITDGTNSLFSIADAGTTGNGIFTGDLGVNGSNLTSSNSTTFNLLNTNVKTLNVGGAADTLNLAGGSSSTGCTIDSSGNITCTGTITSGGGGAVGYWSRSGTVLSPTTQGDTLALDTRGNASGNLLNVSFGASTTLAGALAGLNLDLATNVIANNQNVTGTLMTLPTNITNASGTTTIAGLVVSPAVGSGIQQSGAGATTYSAASLTIPALTQSAGTLIGNGLLVTTPSSITTAGTANGINIAASGIGAGNLNGINISGITQGLGSQVALNVGSGWNDVLNVNGTTVINGSGVTTIAGGGTGLTSYAAGDLIYASQANTLANLTSGSSNNGKVLTVVGGLPTWGNVSGSSCLDCVTNDPSATQTITPTGASTTGLIVKQTSTASPANDIFDVTDSSGSIKYFSIDKNGNVSTAGTSGQTLTLKPLSDETALTLDGTNVTTASLQNIKANNQSGTIFNVGYNTAQTLNGSLIGEALDLSTNLTVTDQSVTGLSLTLPGVTNTSSTSKTIRGVSINTGGGINSGTQGSTTYSAADLTIPALTQGIGSTLTANGVNITTPSSITTGGVANGINIAANGVGAGSLNGINISSITAGGGAETGLNIGSGWDNSIALSSSTSSTALTLNPNAIGSSGALNITANGSSTIDTGSGNTLSLQTTNGGNTILGGNLTFTGPVAKTITGPGLGALSLVNTGGNLVLNTATSGNINLTSAGAINLTAASPSTVTLASNSTTALNFQSGLLDLDTTNSRVGIGTNAPSYGLDVAKKTVAFNSGQDGSLGAFTTNSNALPGAVGYLSSVSAGGYIYVVGSGSSSVYYAKLNADGSTGTWSTNANSLPDSRIAGSAVTANGYIYLIGGENGSSIAEPTVYYAKLNADGSTGTWSTNSNALPVNSFGHASVVANGYVYVLGGDDVSPRSTVYYAKLNADGSTGTWSTNSNALPQVLYRESSIVANGYIYAIGGSNGSSVQSTVYYAKLNADGSTGTWSTNANALPQSEELQSSVAANGYVYAIGGFNGAFQSTVYYAKLNADGSTGTWSTNANALPQLIGASGTGIANGYIYILGGQTTGFSMVSTVYYASTARVSIAADLDLIGLTSGQLTGSNGTTAGSIYAGNIFSNNNLEVEGNSTIWGNSSIAGNLNLAGSLNLSSLSASSGVYTDANKNLTTTPPTSGTLGYWSRASSTLTPANSGDSINTTGTYKLNGSTILSAPGTNNLFVGVVAGNQSTSGSYNVANGNFSLGQNTSGSGNSASGYSSLQLNTTGSNNTANGIDTLSLNTTGSGNLAEGYYAGVTSSISNANTTGSNNTFLGYQSGPGTSTQLTNATAIGNAAIVSCSNCLTLGSINGVNGATSSTNVGIGTASPTATFQVASAATTTNASEIDANSLTSGSGLYLASSSLTSGTLASLSSTSTALTSGGLLSLDWSPGSSTTATGDLLSLNVGTNGIIGNLLNIKNGGSSIFSISQSQVTDTLPTQFTAPGDVSVAYDLNFTNPTSSFIKSQAPLVVQSGETFNSSDLTLRTFNSGQGVFDFAGGVTLNQTQAWTLGSGTTALNFQDSSANSILNLDSTNDWVGIGTNSPSATLNVNGSFTQSSGTANINASSNNATNINTGTSTGAVSIGNSSAGTLTLASGTASSFTTTGANLTLSTATSGTLALTSAGALNFTSNANSTWTLNNSSTTALNIGSNLLDFDTSNSRVGIGTNSPSYGLDVAKKSVAFNSGVDGSISGWNTSGNLIQVSFGLQDFGSAVGNGYIYTTGGYNGGSTFNSVYYAKVNGSGGNGSWTATTSLPSTLTLHSSLIVNGYIYAIGGRNSYSGSDVTTVYYAKVNSDGTVGAWNTTTALPQARSLAPTVAAQGYIYVLGGNSLPNTTVYYAKVNSDGTVGAWNTTTALPTGLAGMTANIANGYLYVLGGSTNGFYSGAVSTVYYAKLNSDGTVGTWNTTTALQQALLTSSSVVSNGQIYLLGGENSSINYVNNVYYAKLNSDGTVGTWNTTTALPTGLSDAQAVYVDGYIYFIGGENNSAAATQNTYYAQVATVSIAANLDLLGLTSSELTGSNGNVGGSIYAGNIFSNSNLEVEGNSTIWGSSSVAGSISSGSDITASNTTILTGTLTNDTTAGTCTATNSDSTHAVIQTSTSITTSYILYNSTRTKHARITSVSTCNDGTNNFAIATLTDSITSQTSGDSITIYNPTSNLGTSSAGFFNNVYGVNGQFVTATTTGGFDVAEEYPTNDTSIEPGDVVSADKTVPGIGVAKSNKAYDSTVMGVISTNPGLSLGEEKDPTWKKVALSGRVPVKVSTENGPISKGDFLTSSSIPGVAMKATRPGETIGKALEDYTNSDPTQVGKIQAFINVGFADPNNALANLSIDDQGNLIVPSIKTGQITLDQTLVEQGNVNQAMLTSVNPDGTLNSSNLTQVGTPVDPSTSSEIADLSATIQNINSKVMDLNNQVASQSAEIARVKSQTDVLSAQVASQSAQIASLSAQIAQQASSSAVIARSGNDEAISNQIATDSANPRNDITDLNLTPPSILMATGSATLNTVNVADTLSSNNISVNNIQVSNIFKSLGQTELGQTTIAGDLSVDGTFSINNGNSINALPTLYLQDSSLAQSVDLFNGQVTIDKTGNLSIQKLTIQATQSPTSIDNPTIGSGVIKAGQTSVTIQNNQATTTSKIFVTPRSSTNNQVLVVSSINNGKSFTISINNAINQDISFDWWIVETK